MFHEAHHIVITQQGGQGADFRLKGHESWEPFDIHAGDSSMKIGLSFLPQIQSLLINSPDPQQLADMDVAVRAQKTGGGWIAKQITEMVAQIAGTFDREHTDDGTHKTITASGSVSERGRTIAMGEWIPIPFNAGNFTASGSMTWTVAATNVTALKYMLVGKTCFVLFNLVQTSVGGTMSTGLRLALPSALMAKDTTITSIRVYDNAAWVSGVAIVNSPLTVATILTISREDNANFTASSATTSVQGLAVFEVK